MTAQLPPIYFFISNFDWITANMPNSADVYLPNLQKHGISDSEYCWILQTYLRLRDDGFSVKLIGNIPDEGIVLIHRNNLTFDFKPGPKLLVICVKADKEESRLYPQLHIVQNNQETQHLRDSHFMLHWPQPGLIPRNPARKDKFETVAFFGTRGNLSPEFSHKAWQEQLNSLGLRWIIKSRWQWNDFSDVDVVLAVRNFQGRRPRTSNKPPTKLYNAWHASVPVILGPEPAFQELRKTELDYIEVNSLEETIAALKYLRDHQEFRQAMVDNGRIRAEQTKYENITANWRNFLSNIAIPTYKHWCNQSNLSKKIFFTSRYLSFKLNKLEKQIFPIFSSLNQ